MAAHAEAPAAAAEAAPKKKGKMGLLLIIVGLVVVLAGGGGAGWFFFLRPHGPVEAKKEETHKPPEHIIKAGTLVVNIAGTEGRRYLRTTLEVGAGPKDAKHLEELRPLMLDAANGVLGTKPLDELLEPDGREDLKEELKHRLNEAVGHGKKDVITHVMLTEFVIQ